MKRVVIIIIPLLISASFCAIARPLGQKGKQSLAAYWNGLSHPEGPDQSDSDFWTNIRECCGNTSKVASKDCQSAQELCHYDQYNMAHVLDQIKSWLLYLGPKVKSGAVCVKDGTCNQLYNLASLSKSVASSLQNGLTVGLDTLRYSLIFVKNQFGDWGGAPVVPVVSDVGNQMVEAVPEQKPIPLPQDAEVKQVVPQKQEISEEIQTLNKESVAGDAFIAQVKDALRDVVNTSIADVREQAKLVSQDVRDTLRDVTATALADTRQQVQLASNEIGDLLQKAADIRTGALQKTDEHTPAASVPEHTKVAHMKKKRKNRVEKVNALQAEESDLSSGKFDELLEYRVAKHEDMLPAVTPIQTYQMQQPYYQPSPQMMPMQQMQPTYQPTQQMSAMAMQMQASAMAMQAQASALMMQAQQQQVPIIPTVVQATTRDATKQEKIHQCMSCIQQVFREGEGAVQRLLLIIDLEFDLLESLLANNTGQAIDRALQERNAAMRKSLAVVAVAYDNLMDLATTYNNDDTGARLYHYYVRKSKRATQPVIPKNKKQFLMRIMYVLEHYYEMIEKMQRVSNLSN